MEAVPECPGGVPGDPRFIKAFENAKLFVEEFIVPGSGVEIFVPDNPRLLNAREMMHLEIVKKEGIEWIGAGIPFRDAKTRQLLGDIDLLLPGGRAWEITAGRGEGKLSQVVRYMKSFGFDWAVSSKGIKNEVRKSFERAELPFAASLNDFRLTLRQ